MAVNLYSKVRRKVRSYLQHNTPACSEVARIMSRSLDGSLSLRERIALRLHLLVCQHCVRYLRQLLKLRAIMRRARGLPLPEDSAPALSPKARERIKSAVREKSL